MNGRARLRRTLAWLFTLLALMTMAAGVAFVGLIWASPGETGPWGIWDTGGEPGYEAPFRKLATIVVSLPTILATLGFGAVARYLRSGIQRQVGAGPHRQ